MVDLGDQVSIMLFDSYTYPSENVGDKCMFERRYACIEDFVQKWWSNGSHPMTTLLISWSRSKRTKPGSQHFHYWSGLSNKVDVMQSFSTNKGGTKKQSFPP